MYNFNKKRTKVFEKLTNLDYLIYQKFSEYSIDAGKSNVNSFIFKYFYQRKSVRLKPIGAL